MAQPRPGHSPTLLLRQHGLCLLMEQPLLPVLLRPCLQRCLMSMTTAADRFRVHCLQPSLTIRLAVVLSSTPTRILVVMAQPRPGHSPTLLLRQHGLCLLMEQPLLPVLLRPCLQRCLMSMTTAAD